MLGKSIYEISEHVVIRYLEQLDLMKGQKHSEVAKAIRILISDIQEGSTIIQVESERLKDALSVIALSLLKREDQVELLNKTPYDLFVTTLNQVLSKRQNEWDDIVDKNLLKRICLLKRAFHTDDEKIVFCYEGNSEKVVLTQKEVDKLVDVEKRVPEPRFIIVNGIIDQLTYSKRKVKIKTEQGIMEGLLFRNCRTGQNSIFLGERGNHNG